MTVFYPSWLIMSSKFFLPSGKTWGVTMLRPTDKDLPSLKMKYLCEALAGRTGRLLEVGSSAGKHLRSLIALGYPFEYHGIDIDRDSLNFGQRVTPSVLFVVGDGHRLPYREESFDAVLLMDFLEHVDNPKLATEEARRILKRGGVLCVFVPCEGNPLSIYALFKRVFTFNVKGPAGGHVQDFMLSDIAELAFRPGYRIVSVYYSYHMLGAFMDFILFVFVYLSRTVETLYWRHNRFYHGTGGNPSPVVAIFNATLTCMNKLAFLESWWLRRSSRLACGVHLTLAKAW
jgi:SAM-dependent methyltransferase